MKKILCLALCLASFGCVVGQIATDNPLPSWAFGGFERPEGVNPLIVPNPESTFHCPMREAEVKWELADTFNPAAVVKDGKICILYRAEDNPDAGIGGRTSRIGLAESGDGVHVDKRSPVPVMYPDQTEVSKTYEWDGGCEDPRVVEGRDAKGNAMYVMTYTSWNHDKPRLSIATSPDLRKWTKHGPAFLTAIGGKYKDLACKSGSIVTEVRDGRLVAAKVTVGGEKKYLMYWGEEWVCAATSDDLVTWTPYVDSNNDLVYLAKPRKGYFDSMLTECGPPAVVTPDGIVLLYNGKNATGTNGDMNYPSNTYAAGQMLFDKSDPLRLATRLDKPFFRPMTDFEKSGQYAAGTVFIEGLVLHNGKYYLYYGCADSMVGVAVYDPDNRSGYGDPITTPVPVGVINNYPNDGHGKMRCAIHSYSGKAADDESPFYLNTSYVYPGRKWCDTSEGDSWVVFEFTDYYKINRFVFRDVEGHEVNCGNVPEYWIYGSKTGADGDWTEIAHEKNVADMGVKDVSFAPVEVRYVKLVLKKGVRPDGRDDNAVRIYGCDIYGEYSGEVVRDGVVSIGKTMLKAYDCVNERESAINLIDGNHSDKNTKWCFYRADMANDPYKFAVIDLEGTYDISRFVMYDCRTIEPDENVTHYQVYVSETLPDVDLITPQGDANNCWELVVDKADCGSESLKDELLEQPVRGRYVKLVVPRTADDMNNQTSKIYAFDVYGSIATGIGQDVDGLRTVSVYPKVVPGGGQIGISGFEGQVDVKMYSMSGGVVYDRSVSGGRLEIPFVPAGCYIIKVVGLKGNRQESYVSKITVI